MSGQVLPNTFRDPYLFEEVLGLCEEINSDAEELDLSRLTFIEPYSMLSMLLLGRNYLRKKGVRLRLVNLPLSIHQYLVRMDFFKNGIFTTAKEIDEGMMFNRSTMSRRIIEVTEIPNKERESVRVITDVISLFRKRAEHIMKFWLSETIVDSFVTVISELCQNIFEHSLDSGFLAMQTYSAAGENIVRLVISDSGLGIEKSFEGMGLDYPTPAHLIERSLTTPLSSKREFGYGLCQVNSIVEKLSGMIFLRSASSSVSAVYHRKGRGVRMFLKNGLKNFGGTQICISLSDRGRAQ